VLKPEIGKVKIYRIIEPKPVALFGQQRK